jgi:hypothetical protein
MQTEVIMFNRLKMIGLTLVGVLAILSGTRAEAHYMYVNGRYYYHSVGCEAAIASTEADPWTVDCAVATTLVETLCQRSGSFVYPPVLSPIQLHLVAQGPIAPNSSLQLEAIVSDAPLLNVNLNLACSIYSTPLAVATPAVVLIHNLTSVLNVYQCTSSSCSGEDRTLTSTASTSCTLPLQFNLQNYPANLPPVGTEYNCLSPQAFHVN